MLAAAAADVALDPVHNHLPLCPLHALTGWYCPFCGALRAVDLLLRGHPVLAARANLLLVLAVPVAVVTWCLWAVGAPRRPRWSRAATTTAVAVLAAFTLVRNLPFAAVLRP